MNHISKYSLFENNDEQLSEADIRSYLDEGRLFVAKQAREKALYTEALKLLNLVHTAEASFQTALVYFLLKRLLVLSSLWIQKITMYCSLECCWCCEKCTGTIVPSVVKNTQAQLAENFGLKKSKRFWLIYDCGYKSLIIEIDIFSHAVKLGTVHKLQRY